MKLKGFHLILLLWVWTSATYLFSLGSGFVFDDGQLLDGRIQQGTIQSLIDGPRPLLMLTYKMDYWLGGLNPFNYHLTNLIIHLLTVTFAFLLLRQLLVTEWPALGGALLFAVHPYVGSAVGYVSGRSSVLAGMFVVLGLWLLVMASKRSKWYILQGSYALTAIMCGLASKQEAISGVVMGVGWLWISVSQGEFASKRIRNIGLCLLLAIIVAGNLVYPYALNLAHQTKSGIALVAAGYDQPLPQPQFALNIIGSLTYHLPRLVLPVELSGDPKFHAEVWQMIVGVIVVLVGGCVVVLGTNFNQVTRFGTLLLLSPVLVYGFVPLVDIVQEHRAYLSVLGLGLLIGQSKLKLDPRIDGPYPWLYRDAPYVGVGLLLSLLTFAHLQTFSTPLKFWANVTHVNPLNVKGWSNLGAAQQSINLIDDARQSYSHALQLDPKQFSVRSNMAAMDINARNYAVAAQTLLDLVRDSPNFSPAWANLSAVYLNTGKLDEALAAANRAIGLDPTSVPGYYNRAEALRMMGKAEEAKVAYAEAARLRSVSQ